MSKRPARPPAGEDDLFASTALLEWLAISEEWLPHNRRRWEESARLLQLAEVTGVQLVWGEQAGEVVAVALHGGRANGMTRPVSASQLQPVLSAILVLAHTNV